LRFFKKAIRYLYGCLHMANNIIRYGRMSKIIEKASEFQDGAR
jgi:hypothetical protein